MTATGIRTVFPPVHQAPATIDQAAPVQNTWYTVLDTTTFVRILAILAYVDVANETIEVRLTIDGQTLTGSQAALAGTSYCYGLQYQSNSLNTITAGVNIPVMNYCFLEGKSVKVEVRKTTALGAGNLHCLVTYQKW